jgi:hypothetical protein
MSRKPGRPAERRRAAYFIGEVQMVASSGCPYVAVAEIATVVRTFFCLASQKTRFRRTRCGATRAPSWYSAHALSELTRQRSLP